MKNHLNFIERERASPNSELKEILSEWFDEEEIVYIFSAIRNRQTLLIEGGGTQLMPSRKLGHKAYMEWREKMKIEGHNSDLI